MSPKKDKMRQTDEQTSERKHNLKKEIGIRIRQVRKMQGLTQAEMVEFFDCGRANYSRIEKGEVFPNPTILKTIHNRFNISLKWLICEEGVMQEGAEPDQQPVKSLPNREPEFEDMLLTMELVPQVRHSILGYFLEYKAKYKQSILPVMEENLKKQAEEDVFKVRSS